MSRRCIIIALLCLCLIAFIPKKDFQKSPAEFIQVLKEIWQEKHPGQKNPTVTIEEKKGQIKIVIDQPKRGV